MIVDTLCSEYKYLSLFCVFIFMDYSLLKLASVKNMRTKKWFQKKSAMHLYFTLKNYLFFLVLDYIVFIGSYRLFKK